MGRKYYLNTYGGAECYFSVNPLAGLWCLSPFGAVLDD